MKKRFSFLGQGWSFPPSFSKEDSGVKVVSEEEDIQQSLDILLNTSPDERSMRPEYGCDLRQFLFESLTTQLKAEIEEVVRISILYHEPRIDAKRIEVKSYTDNHIEIEVEYIVRSTNSRRNQVIPYFVNEGNRN